MSIIPASSPHLLVVEDDRDILHFLQEALEEEGYGVTPAASLPDSLRALEEQLFHLVLTDLFSQDGHSPFESIQPLLTEAAPIPVGIMTGWKIPDDIVAQENLAFLLKKPFDLDDLLRALDAGVHPRLSNLRQEELVEQFFLAVNAHDWRRLTRLCTPEVVVASPVSFSSTSLQLPGYLERLEERVSLLPGYTIEESRVFARWEGVAARYIVRWQSSDGIIHRAAGSMHFFFRSARWAA